MITITKEQRAAWQALTLRAPLYDEYWAKKFDEAVPQLLAALEEAERLIVIKDNGIDEMFDALDERGAFSQRERGIATARIAELERENEGLQAKVLSLAPHGTCACAWDAPDDVCGHHSPALSAANARIAELERERDMAREYARDQIIDARESVETYRIERDSARTALAASQAECARLREALNPFADVGRCKSHLTSDDSVLIQERWDGGGIAGRWQITWGDLSRAHAAHEGREG